MKHNTLTWFDEMSKNRVFTERFFGDSEFLWNQRAIKLPKYKWICYNIQYGIDIECAKRKVHRDHEVHWIIHPSNKKKPLKCVNLIGQIIKWSYKMK